MTHEPYQLRHARPSDCPALARMRRDLQDTMESENGDHWPMKPARKAGLETFFAAALADPEVDIWVAEHVADGTVTPVGTITGRIGRGHDIDRFGRVDDAWVDPEHRGNGQCRRLLDQLVPFFERHEVDHLQLGFIHGGAAGAVWQRLGFRPAVVLANGSLNELRQQR